MCFILSHYSRGELLTDMFVKSSVANTMLCILYQFPAVFGAPVNGHFENVHWTMEPFVHELCRRRRRLSFIMMPPGNLIL